MRNTAAGETVVQVGVVHGDVVVGGGPAVPRELPAGTAGFVGRETELGWLDRALGAPEGTSVAVVSGTAGVGKTALAVWWAHRAASRFPGGQLYANLRGFDAEQPLSPLEVLSFFLRSLGVERPEELRTLAERSARFRSLVSGRRVLVVLDNARDEQQVLPLLPGDGAVLVTSRTVLAGLHVHHAADLLRLEPLSDGVGARLLVSAVGDRVAGERDAVEGLVATCAGLPLALRIVSERLVCRPLLTAGSLLTELRDERARLGSLSAVTDLRAVFSWSYQQLDAQGAAVFRAVGLGPWRGFDAAGLAAVCGLPAEVVARTLEVLARSHLVTETAEDRYDMHDLLRVYARELAHAHDDPAPDEAIRRLFDRYLHSADQADRILTPQRDRIPLAGDSSTARAFADGPAARRWLDQEESAIIALFRTETPGADTQRWQLAHVLRTYFYLTKKLDSWLESYTRALAAAVRSGDRRAEALTSDNLGLAMSSDNRAADALPHHERALDLFGQVGDGRGRSHALANIASVLRRQGRPAEALVHQQDALAYYRQVGDLCHAGITLRGMAGSLIQLGEAAEAITCAREAVDIATRLTYDLDIAQAENTLGEVFRFAGDAAAAGLAFHRALDLSRRCGSRFEEARALRGLGAVALDSGRAGEAAGHWRAALDSLDAMGSPKAQEVVADLGRVAGGVG